MRITDSGEGAVALVVYLVASLDCDLPWIFSATVVVDLVVMMVLESQEYFQMTSATTLNFAILSYVAHQ
ncbi:hypothetical protein ACH5RR_018605 [Cinchona calisaya]|uniref:Uncharacterized protein n=1 Tax=Cinchona calisaya TaxID=153742 RepID=A0ABD2ZM16_9GENT